jgi:hypothetical protein
MKETKLPVLGPSAITAGWLEQALLNNDIETKIKSFAVETVGTGQLGETRRFIIKYSDDTSPNLPKTLVGKFPSDNKVAAATGKDMGFYRGEVMFYRELASKTKTKTPICYAAEIDSDNNFVLLLEDLAPATAGDHMAGCSVENARLALKEGALLHAAFWEDSELEKKSWLYVPEGAQGFYTTDLIETSWAYFRANFASQMDPEVISLCDKYVSSHESWNQPRKGPKCFSHNDFRADNMLFGEKKVTVVDWQTSNYLATGMDVAYFIGSAFDRETRRSVERDLLKEYHQTLVSEGVSNYDLNQLQNDYMHYSFAVLAVAIAAVVIVKRSNRGDQLFMKMVTDGAYQAIDNNALDLL